MKKVWLGEILKPPLLEVDGESKGVQPIKFSSQKEQ